MLVLWLIPSYSNRLFIIVWYNNYIFLWERLLSKSHRSKLTCSVLNFEIHCLSTLSLSHWLRKVHIIILVLYLAGWLRIIKGIIKVATIATVSNSDAKFYELQCCILIEKLGLLQKNRRFLDSLALVSSPGQKIYLLVWRKSVECLNSLWCH